MGDIGQCIFQLAFGKRTMAPVGKARRFVDFHMRDLARQGLVGGGVAKTAHHGGDLGVEQRIGQDAALKIENLDVLAGGMQHLHDVVTADQVVKRLQVEARGKGIDNAFAARRRHLYQAQFGIIGLVAQEFGVQRQIGRARQFGHKSLQRVIGLDYSHWVSDSGFGRKMGI